MSIWWNISMVFLGAIIAITLWYLIIEPWLNRRISK